MDAERHPKRLTLVIPAYDEERVEALEQGLPRGRVVLVVNEQKERPSERNRKLIRRYRGREDVQVIDLTGERAIDGGVGEARARGFEEVLGQISETERERTWIRTTDADAVLTGRLLEAAFGAR